MRFNAALRQAERELDEVTLQYRTALQRQRLERRSAWSADSKTAGALRRIDPQR